MGRKIVAAPTVSLVSAKFIVFAFIGLAIGAAVLLTRGVLPKSTLTPPEATGDLEIVVEDPGSGEKGLQLRTIKFKECSQTSATVMMLDRSGSMDTPPTKMASLKEAASNYASNLSDDSIIGIQSFDSGSITEDVKVKPYGEVKAQVAAAIAALTPRGQTPTRRALMVSRDILKQAVIDYPDKNFSYVFVSDGRPVDGSGKDPNSEYPDAVPPNPADEIKALGVTVYTIAIGADAFPDVMRMIASGPETMFSTPTGAELKDIYKKIATRQCSLVK